MALHWKLYDRDKKLLAATYHAADMWALLSARAAVGDTVKRMGLTVLRVEDKEQVAAIPLVQAANLLWSKFRAKYDAKLARLTERADKYAASVSPTAAGLLEAGRGVVIALAVGDDGTHADPALARRIIERATKGGE